MRRPDILRVATIRTPRDLRLAMIDAIAEKHGCTRADIMSARRDSLIIAARYEAVMALRDLGDSWPKIGALFRRDHTTLLKVSRAEARRAAHVRDMAERLGLGLRMKEAA